MRKTPGRVPGPSSARRDFLLHMAPALALMGAAPAWPAAVPAVSRPLALALHLPLTIPGVRTLANGLQLITLPDPHPAGQAGSGTVAVQVWYRVGAKDDPPGRSGFAHLFEHMMFKRTRHLADEAFDRLTEDVGGQNNAFTTEDATAYLNVVPANHLERLLWAEAERMAHLQVDEANFRSERAVVQAEFRQRVLADPYGRLFHGLAPAFWEVHPYRSPVIGRIPDLDAATLDDVRRFHATYYRPDNAVLIVAGEVDPEQLDVWVDRYFGGLASPATPVPRVTVHEPRHLRDRRVMLKGAQVPAPAVALMWLGPGAAHRDAAALRIAATLLGDGESSRFSHGLVARRQVAQSAGFGADLYADGGMLSAWAIAAGPSVSGPSAALDPRLPQLEEALVREVQQLAHGRVPIDELDKVRTRLLTEALIARQTPEGRASALGWATVRRGDPLGADLELAHLQTVRAEDVQRVLRQHVLGARRVTLCYVQGGAEPGERP